MSDLPATVAEAGLLLQRTSIIGDSDARRQVIEWGHQQIDAEYPLDPIRAPLNVVRRQLAHMEWDRVVRTEGKALRGVIASAAVRDLEFEITRRQEEIRADDAERRRRSAVLFDTEVRIREQSIMASLQSQIRVNEHRATSQINDELARAFRMLDHTLTEAAADAASRRRQEERVLETRQQIDKLIAEALIAAMGPNPTDRVIDAARKSGHEIAEIRANPSLTDDDKHLQIQILLQTLPRTFSDLRARDV